MVYFGEYQENHVFCTCVWPAGAFPAFPTSLVFCVSESLEILDAKTVVWLHPLHVQHPQHHFHEKMKTVLTPLHPTGVGGSRSYAISRNRYINEYINEYINK